MNELMFLKLHLLKLGFVILIFTVGCGSGSSQDDAQSIAKVPINAEICIEGSGQDSKVFIRNLNDFEWGGVTFILTKGSSKTTEYALTRYAPENWPPESQTPATPFSKPKDWINKGKVAGRPQEVLRRLTFFSSLTGSIVRIKKPFEAEWSSSSVDTC